MAGHNKWSKVKHIKARVDAIKGRVFSKCAYEIALAAQAGGADPAANARLRTTIDRPKAMPKGSGEHGGNVATLLRQKRLNMISEKIVSVPQTLPFISDPAIACQVPLAP